MIAALLLLIILSAAVVFITSRSERDIDNQQDSDAFTLDRANLKNSVVETIDIEKLEQQYSDPEELLTNIIGEAGKAEFNGDKEKALSYYLYANEIQGVDVTYRNQALLRGYYIAIELDNEESVTKILGIIGDEYVAEYEDAVSANQ